MRLLHCWGWIMRTKKGKEVPHWTGYRREKSEGRTVKRSNSKSFANRLSYLVRRRAFDMHLPRYRLRSMNELREKNFDIDLQLNRTIRDNPKTAKETNNDQK